MKLVFIYGPPAVGKLTVANELSKLTGFKVLHNHSVIDNVTPLFPFGEAHLDPYRRKLTRKIRLDLYSAAAEANVSFITTFGAAGKDYFDFFRDTKQVIEKQSGQVLFVQLIAAKEKLLERVEEASRKSHGKIDSSEFLTKRLAEKPDTFDKFPDFDHLTIDNSDSPASEVATEILKHYHL